MSAHQRQAADICAELDGAMRRWIQRVGTSLAAAELGIDERTVRRKRVGELGFGSRELSAAIAHELDAVGVSEVAQVIVQSAAAPSPASSARPLDQQVLLLGAGLNEAAAVINRRLADHELSPRDAGLIAEQLRAVVRQAQVELKRLDRFTAAAARGSLP